MKNGKDTHVLEPGTGIVMTKGYKGVRGTIAAKMDSQFEFYVVKLENGINIVAGPTAFEFGGHIKGIEG